MSLSALLLTSSTLITAPSYLPVLALADTSWQYYNTPPRAGYAARAANRDAIRTGGRPSVSSVNTPRAVLPPHQASSLAGIPESVSVQEMAFRQGQRDSASAFDKVPANPFALQFDQLWATYYKLGKECGGQRVPTPVNPSQQNFAWTVLVNPYTQSLKNLDQEDDHSRP